MYSFDFLAKSGAGFEPGSTRQLRICMHMLAVLGTLVTAPFCIRYFLDGQTAHAMAYLVLTLAVAIFWAVGWFFNRLKTAFVVIIACLWIAVSLALFLQGGLSFYNVLPLLLLGPITILGGAKIPGRTLTIISIGTLVVAYIAGASGLIPQAPPIPAEFSSIVAMISIAGYAAIAFVFHRLRQQVYLSAKADAILLSKSHEFGATQNVEVLPDVIAASSNTPISLVQATAVAPTPVDTPLSVLFVDDNLSYLEVMQFTLGDQNIEVATTSSPESAMEFLQSQKFDVIISDLNFGETSSVNGIEFTERVRRGHGLACPIIGVTGNVSKNVKKDWMDAGAFEVLTKPFKLAVLVSTIQRAACAN